MTNLLAYKISLNGKWLVSLGDEMLLTDDIADGKLIEGNFNLKSAIDRLYDKVRYGDLELKELVIKKVSHYE